MTKYAHRTSASGQTNTPVVPTPRVRDGVDGVMVTFRVGVGVMVSVRCVKPNTHRRRRRDETVESRRVGGVYTNSQLVGDSFVVSSV